MFILLFHYFQNAFFAFFSFHQCRQFKNIYTQRYVSSHCHSELVEESPPSTTRFVRKIILSSNLLVSVNALLLSFQIRPSLCSLRTTGWGISLSWRHFSFHYPYLSLSFNYNEIKNKIRIIIIILHIKFQ